MENVTINTSSWSIFQKLSLRFAVIFTILFIFLLDWYSNAFSLGIFYLVRLDKFLDPFIFWVGHKFFSIDSPFLTPSPGNHSDSLYIYILYFSMAVIAILGSVVWSLIDRKNKNLDTLFYWQNVMVRYYLAFNLFAFALEKFFKMQFSDLGLYQLSQPLGDMTPMSLAWAFFGYSYGYNIFMGFAESAALLLLFRRTTPFGALLTVAAMSNVLAVNINYDVHAKMFSAMNLLLAAYLLLPSLKIFYKFLFTEEAVSLKIQKAPIFKKRWMQITAIVFKWVIIALHLGYLLHYYWDIQQRRQKRTPPELYGIYEVQSFVVNQDTLASDNPTRWNQLIFDSGRTAVRLQGDSIAFAFSYFDEKRIFVYDDQEKLMLKVQEIYREQGSYDKIDSIMIERQAVIAMYYELTDSLNVAFRGKYKNDSLFVSLAKKTIEAKDYRLMRSKINVFTEVPKLY